MLKNYKILSGEFRLVIEESNCETAALESIRLHTESNHHSCLGEITMVEHKQEVKFFCTRTLLDSLLDCGSSFCTS